MSRPMIEPYPRRLKHSKDSHVLSGLSLVAIALVAYMIWINWPERLVWKFAAEDIHGRIVSAVSGGK